MEVMESILVREKLVSMARRPLSVIDDVTFITGPVGPVVVPAAAAVASASVAKPGKGELKESVMLSYCFH